MNEVDKDVARAFLQLVYPQGVTGGKGWVNVWTRDGKRSHWYRYDDVADKAVDDLPRLNASGCCWFQTGIMPQDYGSSGRGKKSEVLGYPGLHVDVDVADPHAHKAADLPPDVETACTLIASMGLRPTMVVLTGHGVHGHWLFDKPVPLANLTARERIERLQAGLQGVLRGLAKAKGWTIDGTHDLTRLLRIPGTVNRKPGCTPVPVTMLDATDRPRYSVQGLEAFVAKHLPVEEVKVVEEDFATRSPSPAPVVTAPLPVVTKANHDDDDVLRMCGEVASNREKFRALWQGNHSGYPSQSEGVLALANFLAFYTRDSLQIERLMGRSRLCSGYEKWNREDFRSLTIDKALRLVKPSDYCMGKTAIGQPKEREKQSQGEKLLRLCSSCECWHDSEKKAYVTVALASGAKANYALGSSDFERWLGAIYYKTERKGIAENALAEVVSALSAKAVHEGVEHPVCLRVGGHGGNVYIDLGGDDWNAVEVTTDGWRVVSNPPVKFVRKRGMLPLPVPEVGGSLNDLRPLLNVDDTGWVLTVAWLVGAFRPNGPYPILSISGEQGSAKSTTCRLLRKLIDPHVADVAQPPKSDQDMMLGAANGWVYSLDNLSGVSGDTSDTLCRLATGAAWRARAHYTNDEEHVMQVCRPIMLNGISDVSSRADLVERSLLVHLPTIPPSQRRTEADVVGAFDALAPRLLGALLTAVSAALANGDTVAVDDLPRMADFAKWVTGAETALPFPVGTFLTTYRGNQSEGVQAVLEGNPVAAAVIRLGTFQGQPSDLLDRLTTIHGGRPDKSWPLTARGLVATLKRLAPALRAQGVNVCFDCCRRTKAGSCVSITSPQASETDESWG